MSASGIIPVKHLFKPLDDMLIDLLESLGPDEWQMQTVAKLWTVKDVAAHLLDGNVRVLSIQRDRYFGETPSKVNGYTDLVNWLNQLNADWVSASRRISPEVLILLHKATNNQTNAYYQSLNENDQAIFPVSWTGEDISLNWMHLAREYTEKWHHQQQIREATGREGILKREFFFPMIDTFFRALPFTFKNVDATEGSVVAVNIAGEAGGDWFLEKQIKVWRLIDHPTTQPVAFVSIPAFIAWKLFSKNIRPSDIVNDIIIRGDRELAMPVLNMVSVMA